MSSITDTKLVQKRLLLWPWPVPDCVRASFDAVKSNASDLAKCVSEVICRVDHLYLTVPSRDFAWIREDPVYEFPQVKGIAVLCKNHRDQEVMKRRFPSVDSRVIYCVLSSIHLESGNALLGDILGTTGAISQTMMDAIGTALDARQQEKRRALAHRLLAVTKNLPVTPLAGLPVKNWDAFTPDFACPICKSVYLQPYRLKCGHVLCGTCQITRKR